MPTQVRPLRGKPPPGHRVLTNFMLKAGTRGEECWQVAFLEADCRTSLCQSFTFTSAEKIRELAKRGCADLGTCGAQAMEQGISTGRGSIWLYLTAEQYRKLR